MKPRWGPGKPLETSGSDPVGGRMRLREKASGQTGQWEITGLWKTLEPNSEREREIERVASMNTQYWGQGIVMPLNPDSG